MTSRGPMHYNVLLRPAKELKAPKHIGRQADQKTRDIILRLDRLDVRSVDFFELPKDAYVIKLIAQLHDCRTKCTSDLWGKHFRYLQLTEIFQVLVVRTK